MSFESIPGLKGKIYVPESTDRPQKHCCEECFACQQCSDDRCRICRAKDPGTEAARKPPR